MSLGRMTLRSSPQIGEHPLRDADHAKVVYILDISRKVT